MKTATFFLLLMLATTLLQAQVPSIDEIKTEPVSVNTGITFKLPSKVLGEDRTVWVSVPEGYDGNSKKYPVLYLLDGQWGFNSTTQSLSWLSNPQFGMIPRVIVVGIHTGGEKRMRDLGPTKDKRMRAGGGADKLYKFIKEELIPFVDKNYRTYNYRMICGSSLGGLFTMYALINEPALFNGYLCLSPAMWWDNQNMLNKTNDFLSKNPGLKSKLYLTMANEGVQMGVDSLASLLEKYAIEGLKWKYDKHPDEVHETINYKGIWDGMKFLLADWQYPFVDFGTKGSLFTPPAASGVVTHKVKNQPDKVLDKHCGLYLDTYKRVLIIEKNGKALQFSGLKLPTLALHPETENKFFVKEADIENNLFMKGVDVQFEFINGDSLVAKANGIVDCTAKKIRDLKLAKLTDDVVKKVEGTYAPLGFGNTMNIKKDGQVLKVTEVSSEKASEEKVLTYLYPVGENKFFLLLQGNSYDLEFIQDKSTKEFKFAVSEGGNTVFEGKKVN